MAGKRKLSDANLREMKRLRDQGAPFFQLAKKFNVTYHTVKYWLSAEYRKNRKKTVAACNRKYIRRRKSKKKK